MGSWRGPFWFFHTHYTFLFLFLFIFTFRYFFFFVFHVRLHRVSASWIENTLPKLILNAFIVRMILSRISCCAPNLAVMAFWEWGQERAGFLCYIVHTLHQPNCAHGSRNRDSLGHSGRQVELFFLFFVIFVFWNSEQVLVRVRNDCVYLGIDRSNRCTNWLEAASTAQP